MITMKCQSCGAELDTSTADALCPACLLRFVLEPATDEPENEPIRPALPRTFGPYELVEEIGRGGMGVVYAARQPELDRLVAIKLLLAGAHASEPTMRRFHLEAAAAAKLQHPNIVAIHDYGEVEGQPYYAMDLVTGRNLAEVCAGRPMPARRASELLRLLADAVHYAHQHGVLHRDLKPSNVLVDEKDRPRITDFGLAKLLGSTEGATVAGQMLGSPSYAAPEQAAGRDAEITVASDVYGLGTLFYHLVTGRAPFNAATPAETLRLVLDTDPPPPRLLNPGLPRDLETICLKCLVKDPARRYATAADVAADVELFLGNRPIRARPPGAFYRLQKYTRRHRFGVSAAAGIIVALAIGLVTAFAQYRRALEQRHAAIIARGQAEELVGLMTHDLTPLLVQRGGPPRLQQTAEGALHYYESLPPELRTTKTDRAQANILAALARLYTKIPSNRKNAPAVMRAALVLREKVARENPDDPEAAASWLEDDANSADVIGDFASANSESRAESLIRRGRALHARFPDNLRVNALLAAMLGWYATKCVDTFCKPDAAVAAVAESQALVDQLMAGRLKGKVTDESIGWALGNLAFGLQVTGDNARAAAVCEQALDYFTEALKAEPGNLQHRWFAAYAAQFLSYNCPNSEKSYEVELIAREHYRMLQELDPDNQDYRWGFAQTHSMEFWHLFNNGPDFDAAPKAFHELLAMLKPGYDEFWTCNRLWLAIFSAWAGKTAEARKQIEETEVPFAAFCSKLPESSNERCNARVTYLSVKALALYWVRDWPAMEETARSCLKEIDAGLKRKPGNGPLLCRQADANVFLVIAAQHAGRTVEAITRLPPLIELIRKAPPRDYWGASIHSTLGIAQKALVEAYVQQDDREHARQVADQQLQGFAVGYTWSLNEQDWRAGALTLAASLCGSGEAVRCIGLVDQAMGIITSPAAIGRITVTGKENLATIARLKTEAAANLSAEALERTGRDVDVAAAAGAEASESITRAGEATWNLLPVSSAISSRAAREAELTSRERCRALMDRHPESDAYRFLYAETYRMECYTHLGWDGQVEPARAAFRQYDALLEPFVGRKGYDSVLRTRLFNSLHLAQLAASVGDKAEADLWLGKARKRFEAARERLPGNSLDRRLREIQFLEESAQTAWLLHDWPELTRLAQQVRIESDDGLKLQPTSEEVRQHRAVADAFAALALVGVSPNAKAATQLQAACDGLKTFPAISGFWDGDAIVWVTNDVLIEVLRKSGNVAQARNRANDLRFDFEQWVPTYPEYWPAQKHLAFACVLEVSALNPAVPYEAAKRKELLDQAAAALAPDKVAGRLTVDVQEALQEIGRLRSETAPSTQ